MDRDNHVYNSRLHQTPAYRNRCFNVLRAPSPQIPSEKLEVGWCRTCCGLPCQCRLYWSSIPTTLVRTITVTKTTAITKQCSSTVSYHLPVRRTLMAYSTGFQSHLLSLCGGFSSPNQSCALETCVPLSSTSSTTRDSQPTSALSYHTLSRQDFQCPNGTVPCTLPNPNVCCSYGETRQRVEDLGTGQGNIGCCPDGQTCGGDLLSTCAPGYSSCPNSLGGGCCIPGFTCFDDGCILILRLPLLPRHLEPSSAQLPLALFQRRPSHFQIALMTHLVVITARNAVRQTNTAT